MASTIMPRTSRSLSRRARIGKEPILEDPSRHQIFRNAHVDHLFGDAIDHQIAYSVVAHIIGRVRRTDRPPTARVAR